MSRLNKAAENLTCAIRRHSLGSRSGPRSAVVRSSRLCNAVPSSLVATRCHQRSIWYRLYRKSPPLSIANVLHHFKMHAGLSSRMVLELSRCPLWIISGHCSSLHDLCFTTESRDQLSALGCPLSANKSWIKRLATNVSVEQTCSRHRVRCEWHWG